MRIYTFGFLFIIASFHLLAQGIPLAEHPRPDFFREQWMNLNGTWDFRFDPKDQGLKEDWALHPVDFKEHIQVPFPWGSKLSGQKDGADIAWYHKDLELPKTWTDKDVYLIIGASDWETTVFLDGKKISTHQGGYVPIEVNLSPFVRLGQAHSLVIRVDDKRREFTLYGKQGYGNARGIWQTVYLEARAPLHVQAYHIQPDIDAEKIKVKAYLNRSTEREILLSSHIDASPAISFQKMIPAGASELSFEIPIPKAHLWTLDDPHLYQLEAILGHGQSADRVKTYFGMRSISVKNLPNTQIPYIYLNHQPIYLQLALDQSYHPDGFYTFPSDDFMREEILRSKRLGLNGIRTHVKVEIPRKLYWADKLGLLVMADLPNSWGAPDADMRRESKQTLEAMIQRDFNHPSIFSWIVFNETWGLTTKVEENGKKRSRYLPETQQWVVDMYQYTKSLDPSRLVEDNSICCGYGHTQTDIHSWHSYLPGYEWEDFMRKQSDSTFEGSTWNFEKGFKQGRQPMINSEFGNVWGYKGSTGDVDYTFDYHKAMNVFRTHLKMAGWLYTEHHDVINEWNGYYKFDRSEKETGLSDLVPGMSLVDWHSPFYLSTGQEITFAGQAGDSLKIPLSLSALSPKGPGLETLYLEFSLKGKTSYGLDKVYHQSRRAIEWNAWNITKLDSIKLRFPSDKSLSVLSMVLKDGNGRILHRNFVHLIVEKGNALPDDPKQRWVSRGVTEYKKSQWSQKSWTGVLGNKVNGAGTGYIEYEFNWPSDVAEKSVASVQFLVEASAKPLLGKDRMDSGTMDGDYMLGKGTFDPSKNPNAYPQTDDRRNPTLLRVLANDRWCGSQELPDDPADHQGILSWHYQARNHQLDEPGTYGYWVEMNLPSEAIQEAIYTGKMRIRLEVNDVLPGGLAIYGDKSGRYVLNPSLKIQLK